MYIKADGVYVGMLTQGVQRLQGFNFIVPVRRIHAFAKEAKIEWAIDPTAKMPTLKDIEAIPVEDAAVVGSGAAAAPTCPSPAWAASTSRPCVAGSSSSFARSKSSPPDAGRSRPRGRPAFSISCHRRGESGVTMCLSKKTVVKIKTAIAAGVSQPVIAKRHKVSRSIVSDIATGRVHKDVPWPDGEAPDPRRLAASTRRSPTTTRPTGRSWSWRPRSST